MSQRPFIIWTLQRTGGTNLTQRLVERSGLQGIGHEPFNIGRVYGPITEAWVQNHDFEALKLSVERVVAKKVLIKHCVEMVPWEITKALAKAACDAGYRHLFLYRQNPIGRLLSLQFAKMSGIWGPNLHDAKELNDKIFSESLPVADLVAHEVASNKRLKKVWSYVLANGERPFALSFEELYQADDQNAMTHVVLSLLAYLGLAQGELVDREFARDVVGYGNQGTHRKYIGFKGIDKLQIALDKVDTFRPNSTQWAVNALSCYEKIPWIIYAAIDGPPANIVMGQLYNITGVVVLDCSASENCRLVLRDDSGDEKVEWNIESPWMAKRYPEALNGQCARFKARGLRVTKHRKCQLCVIDGAGNVLVLFRIAADEAKIT